MTKVKTSKPAVAKKDSTRSYLKRYWQLYLLLSLPLLYLLVFKYIPMVYIQIAFKKYSIIQNVWEMPWAKNHGFEYFIQAFGSNDFRRALRNTVVLNLMDLVIGFPAPIIFALILNELCFKRFKKVVQTVAYMPHFLSWVIIYSLALQLFAPGEGLVNMAIERLGGSSIPFLNDAAHWVGTYIGVGVWQNFGWGSIVYLAAIAGVDQSLYEAAKMDGATKLQCMLKITIPSIMPTIVVMLILKMGSIVSVDFEQVFLMNNAMVKKQLEVFEIYIYNNGIAGGSTQYSYTTAIGMFKSVINTSLVLLTNWITNRKGYEGIM